MPARPPGDDVWRRVDEVVAQLVGVERMVTGSVTELRMGGRPFAVLGLGRIEVRLDAIVAAAAARTPAAGLSDRGTGWVVFAPGTDDQFALDRAEAWLRSAHRLASRG
jgi:hypothetical protein